MRRIYIFGCGGSGREILQIVLDLAEAGEQIEPAAFLVDSVFEAPTHVQGLQIFRSLDAPHQDPTAQVVIGLGSPAARKCVARRLEKLGIRCATLIHPRAWIGREVFLARALLFAPRRQSSRMSGSAHMFMSTLPPPYITTVALTTSRPWRRAYIWPGTSHWKKAQILVSAPVQFLALQLADGLQLAQAR